MHTIETVNFSPTSPQRRIHVPTNQQLRVYVVVYINVN